MTATWGAVTTSESQISGSPFLYLLSVACSSTTNEAGASCNGPAGVGSAITVDIPFPDGGIFPSDDGGLTLVTESTPITAWPVSINASTGVLANGGAVTTTATGWEFTLNAMPATGQAVSVTFTLTPPGGYTPDQTTWTLTPAVSADTPVTWTNGNPGVTFTATATPDIALGLRNNQGQQIQGNEATPLTTFVGATVVLTAMNYDAPTTGILSGTVLITQTTGVDSLDFSACVAAGIATIDTTAFQAPGNWTFDTTTNILTGTGLTSEPTFIPIKGLGVGECEVPVTWSYIPIGATTPVSTTQDFWIDVTPFGLGQYSKTSTPEESNGVSMTDSVAGGPVWALNLSSLPVANDFTFQDVLPTVASVQTDYLSLSGYLGTTYCSPGGQVMISTNTTAYPPTACPITTPTPATSASDLAYRITYIGNGTGAAATLTVTMTDGSTITTALASGASWSSGDAIGARIDPAVAAFTMTGSRGANVNSTVNIGGYFPGQGTAGAPTAGIVTPSTVSNTATFTVTDPTDGTTSSGSATSFLYVVSKVVEARFGGLPTPALAQENPSDSPSVVLDFRVTMTNEVDLEHARVAAVLPSMLMEAGGGLGSVQYYGSGSGSAALNTAWSAANSPDDMDLYATYNGTNYGASPNASTGGFLTLELYFTLDSTVAPGIYPVTYYVGFPGKSFSDATDVIDMFGVGSDGTLMCNVPGTTVITDTTGILGPDTVGVATDLCEVQGTVIIVGPTPAYLLTKQVKGNGDTDFVSAPGTANVSSDGTGSAVYQLTYFNDGSSSLIDNVIYDVLPQVGDAYSVGANAGTPRGSQFAVTLTAAPTVPAGWTVAYSQSATPNRPELGLTGVDDWTTTAPTTPAGWAAVKSLMFTNAAAIASGTVVNLTYPVAVPAFTASTQTAWNTAAGAASVAGGGASLAPVETARVGLGLMPALAAPTDPATPVATPALRETARAVLGLLMMGLGLVMLRRRAWR